MARYYNAEAAIVLQELFFLMDGYPPTTRTEAILKHAEPSPLLKRLGETYGEMVAQEKGNHSA